MKKSNIWRAKISIEPPARGCKERNNLMKWLNQEHAGVDHAPEEVSKEHLDSHYTICRTAYGILELELQKDGTSIPLNLSFNGKKYNLVEKD